MDNHRKYFNGGLNADDDFELVLPTQWVNASNVRAFTTDKGAAGRLEAIGGTSLLFNNLPEGTNICIGGCADDANKRLIFLNWNSNGDHGVYCFDKVTGFGYTVMDDADVTGGLGFSKYQYIHSCFFANNCIYWVNGETSQPKRINVESGIKAHHPGFSTTFEGYTLPVKQSVISWIRKPGGLPLEILKVKQVNPEIEYNYIRDSAFQFSYRYNYRGHEISTLSPLSETADTNSVADEFDCIDITFPAAEIFEQDILSIDLVVRFLENDNYFVIKTWSKVNAAEAAQIADHNAGNQLRYRFYNDIAGYALDDAYKVMPFHNVPVYAEAAELAKDRSHIANYTEGYDTPESTSLTINYTTQEVGTSGLSTIIGQWYELEGIPASDLKKRYLIRTTVPFGPISPAAVYYYRLETSETLPPFPLTVDVSDLLFIGSTEKQIQDWYTTNELLPWGIGVRLTDQAEDSTITGGIGATTNLAKAFKSGTPYQVAITFYDEYQRKCGVKTKDELIAYIPEAMASNEYVLIIDWLLSNTNALSEIPAWAHYYSVNITKCLATRYFLQGAGPAIYAQKDPASEEWTFTENAYANAYAGIAVDATSLLSYKMGYTFSEGDIAKLRVGSNEYSLAVIGTQGAYIILELEDVGVLSPTNVIYEISTPYKKSFTEPFYETGAMYKVTDPETEDRAYSILAGAIQGDVYLQGRIYFTFEYVAEAMNANDKTWKQWNTNAGRPNFIDTIGQVKRTNDIRFSDVFIAGSKVNGLSAFSALNTVSLDAENGKIRKLQLTSKVQEDGSVMLAICENETVSCYLGEQELFDTQGSAFIAKANNVIGNTKALRGSMGTNNPESAFEYNGLVIWYDSRNGGYVQYSNNGLFMISNNKLHRPANLFSKKFVTMTAEEIEDLGSRPFVIGGYDPHHKEVLFTIPATETVAPKGTLEDYEFDYPYDIYDGKGKTLVYKNEVDMWMGSASYQAEKFIHMDNDLYSFKDGCLHIHNQGQPANFYGVQNKAQFMYVNNPGGLRTFYSLALEANKTPSFVHFRTEDPYIQSSDFVRDDFTPKEGILYSSLYRDRLSPNVTGTPIERQMKGDRMFGKSLLIMLEYEFTGANPFDFVFDETFSNETGDNLPLELRFSNVKNTINEGHFTNK